MSTVAAVYSPSTPLSPQARRKKEGKEKMEEWMEGEGKIGRRGGG
jgi:hypothetical protein